MTQIKITRSKVKELPPDSKEADAQDVEKVMDAIFVLLNILKKRKLARMKSPYEHEDDAGMRFEYENDFIEEEFIPEVKGTIESYVNMIDYLYSRPAEALCSEDREPIVFDEEELETWADEVISRSRAHERKE